MPGHLRLVPSPAEPVIQAVPLTEVVIEWRGHVEHEPGETPCCHQRIEVTNLVTERQSIIHDIVAELSGLLHEWGDGCDVTMLVRIAPPALPEAPERPL